MILFLPWPTLLLLNFEFTLIFENIISKGLKPLAMTRFVYNLT